MGFRWVGYCCLWLKGTVLLLLLLVKVSESTLWGSNSGNDLTIVASPFRGPASTPIMRPPPESANGWAFGSLALLVEGKQAVAGSGGQPTQPR